MQTWNERLSEAIKDSPYKKSKASFAKAVGVSGATVTDWLKGNIREMKSSHARKVCEVLQINPEWLFDNKGSMRQGTKGWMDPDHGDNVIPLRRKNKGNDVIEIARLEVSGGLGGGVAVPVHEQVIEYLAIQKRFILENFVVSKPEALRVITGDGDSMKGSIDSGDLVLVDTGDVVISDKGGIFALFKDGELIIKRVRRQLNNIYTIISDNPLYKDYDLTAEEFAEIEVRGRAVWVWNGKKL